PNDDTPPPNTDLMPLKNAFLPLKGAELSTLEWDNLDEPPFDPDAARIKAGTPKIKEGRDVVMSEKNKTRVGSAGNTNFRGIATRVEQGLAAIHPGGLQNIMKQLTNSSAPESASRNASGLQSS